MTFRRAIGACMLAALFVGAPVSCLIETEAPKGGCKGDADCDDMNPCTDDACAKDGFCDHNLRDAPPEGSCPDNNPCTREACSSDAKCTNVPDDTLVPDDGNECTADACQNASAQHTDKPDSTKCGLNGVLSCTAGKCVCANTSDCGATTLCITYECKDMACTSSSATQGTLVDSAADKDCKKNVCDGKGGIITVADAADYPPDPTVQDCKKPSCDADGNIVDVAEPTDAPVDDQNVCTMEGCNGTMAINHTPVTDGTACGAGQTCAADGAGGFQTVFQPVCMAGGCQSANAQSCGLYGCNNADCRTSCDLDAHCIGAAYCDVAPQSCKLKIDQGQPCGADNQCKTGHCADGVCCDKACASTCQSCNLGATVGMCANIPSGQNPDGDCAGGQACNGAGACAKPQGSVCNADGDCISGQCEDNICCNVDCSGDCRRCDISGSVGMCTNVASGVQSGQCVSGKACDGNNNCKSQLGKPCNGPQDCLSANCPSEGNGNRVCCDTSCSSTCQSCRGSKTGGTDGTCGYINVNTDPDGDCPPQGCNTMTGSGCCNGNGGCIP